VRPLIVPYLPLNPLLPRPKGDKDAEGMKKQIPSSNPSLDLSASANITVELISNAMGTISVFGNVSNAWSSSSSDFTTTTVDGGVQWNDINISAGNLKANFVIKGGARSTSQNSFWSETGPFGFFEISVDW